MTPTQLVAFLNALTCGDVSSLTSKLDEARAACVALGQESLAGCIDEARSALSAGDLKTYRRRIETAVSRLGHLR